MIDLSRLRELTADIKREVRRLHPEAITPRQWIQLREWLLERIDHLTDTLERVQGEQRRDRE